MDFKVAVAFTNKVIEKPVKEQVTSRIRALQEEVRLSKLIEARVLVPITEVDVISFADSYVNSIKQVQEYDWLLFPHSVYASNTHFTKE